MVWRFSLKNSTFQMGFAWSFTPYYVSKINFFFVKDNFYENSVLALLSHRASGDQDF